MACVAIHMLQPHVGIGGHHGPVRSAWVKVAGREHPLGALLHSQKRAGRHVLKLGKLRKFAQGPLFAHICCCEATPSAGNLAAKRMTNQSSPALPTASAWACCMPVVAQHKWLAVAVGHVSQSTKD